MKSTLKYVEEGKRLISLVKGQKVELTKSFPQLSSINIGLSWDVNSTGQNEFDLDATALLVGTNGKIISQKHVIYYNNPSQYAVKLSVDNRSGIGSGDDEEIFIQLNQIPTEVEKIVLAISIHDAEGRKQTFGQVSNAFARIMDVNSNNELYRYNLGHDFSGESAVVIGEVYRYKGEWKFGAVGMGINGALKGLCEEFGLENLPSQFFLKTPKPQASNSSNKIKLSKIELKKSGDTINLTKTSKTLGEILVNLNWNKQNGKQSNGLLSSIFGNTSTNPKVDLDLGCLFEFKNGWKSAIQPLGNNFGSYQSEPYIHLDQDDRTGASVNGENLRINGNRISEIKRILIFSYIYEGVANWSEVDGVITIKQQDGPDIVVRMDEHRNGKGMCAIAMLENINDETFKIQKLVKYFSGHKEMDRKYGWNLNWVAGRK